MPEAPAPPVLPLSAATPGGFPAFLERLRSYERLEPLAKSRGPEKLDGVRALAGALGHPEASARTVHVAGTNGKGLSCAMLARLLADAGHRVGLYTSPHVVDMRERITQAQAGGDAAPLADAVLARAGHRVLDAADALRQAHHFSYFDLLTLCAWEAFRAAAMDWVVLETGLGGLSDATNIAPKELAVLTRIGLDHLHILGDSLQGIAAQKLGIVPPGTPAVLAEQPSVLLPWLRATLRAQGSAVDEVQPLVLTPEQAAALPPGTPYPTPPRLACAATALRAAQHLLGAAQAAPSGEDGEQARLHAALSVRLLGRLELRRGQRVAGCGGAPLRQVVLDGGHNADAVAALSEQLKRWGIRDYTLLLSLQSDKLVPPLREPMARLLAGAARLITLAPRSVRAPSTAALTAYLEAALRSEPAAPAGAALPPHTVCRDPAEALRLAAAEPERPLVVAGSFWTLGDVIPLLSDAPLSPATGRPTRVRGA